MYQNIKNVYDDLREAWLKQGLPSTLLIRGKLGVGKKVLALHLAQLITCENKEQSPCKKCFSCLNYKWEEGEPQAHVQWMLPLDGKSQELLKAETRAEKVLDTSIEILKSPYHLKPYSDSAKQRVEAVRDLMKTLAGGSSKPRVVIIPEADRMEPPVANALLKILEEAPENTWFILTTSHPEKLLNTITSRSLKIALPSLNIKDYAGAMVGHGEFNPEELEWLYFFSEGAIGYGMTFNGQEVLNCRDFCLEILRRSRDVNPGSLLKFIETDVPLNEFLNHDNLDILWRMFSLIIDQLMRREFSDASLQESLAEFADIPREKLFRMSTHLEKITTLPPTVRAHARLSKLGLEWSLIEEGVL
jgi:hypothetical protein